MENEKKDKFLAIKKLLARLGLVATLGTATLSVAGCGNQAESDSAVKTESSIDDTEEVKDETSEVVETPVVETPVVETPVVEAVTIAPITVEDAEARITEIMTKYPKEPENLVRGAIALLNKEYFENEEDYLTVLGVSSSSDITDEELLGFSEFSFKSVSRTYDLNQGVAESQLGADQINVPNFEEAAKFSEFLIPTELSKLGEVLDSQSEILLNIELSDKTRGDIANNLGSLLFNIKVGNETLDIGNTLAELGISEDSILYYSMFSYFSAYGSNYLTNTYYDNYDKFYEVTDSSYPRKCLGQIKSK